MAINLESKAQFSAEDALRLNVLIKQSPRAIRIDEPAMTVHALTATGEAKVVLSPTCREDRYLRHVREFFSYHALGSPGGYPVFLDRWTRTEHSRDEQSLDALLLLGEPEAVVAVAHSPGLSEERARRVWWALNNSDVARRLLGNPNVVQSEFGKEIAAFLVEHLPFESEPSRLANTVRLVLQDGLVSEETKLQLWSRGKRKNAYWVGFLHALPDALPLNVAAHTRSQSFNTECAQRLQQGNRVAHELGRIFSANGQAYLHTLAQTLEKLPNQEMTVLLFNALDQYLEVWPEAQVHYDNNLASSWRRCQDWVQQGESTEIVQIVDISADYAPYIAALMCLSTIKESHLDPVFSQTDAIGSVMRKRLAPLTTVLLDIIGLLRS